MVTMTWSALFWREYVLLVNNFDVSHLLAERQEASLRLLARQRVRGGSQHEVKLLLTSGGRATIHLVSDCQKHYCRTIDFRKRRRAKRKVTY